MGYHTDFYGEWEVTPALKQEHLDYLRAFAETRRMKRDAEIAETLPDPIRIAAGLPIGFEGAYYVGGFGQNMGQDKDESVIDSNEPPGTPLIPLALHEPYDAKTWGAKYDKQLELKAVAQSLGLAQPGLWCQWTPNGEGTAIVWDEGEKFYYYIEWIEYLIEHFLAPWGYKLNGEVSWDGESSDDRGIIRITDNVVSVGTAVITYNFT